MTDVIEPRHVFDYRGHSIDAINGAVSWTTETRDPAFAEYLRISIGAPTTLPIASISYGTARADCDFSFHGISLDRDAKRFRKNPGVVSYRLVNGATWEIPDKHLPDLHRVCLYIDEDGETALAAPYPQNFEFLCREGRILRSLIIIVCLAWVTREGSKVFAERRWHPFLGKEDRIAGLQHPYTDKQIRRAASDFRLFKDPRFNAKGGRPERRPDEALNAVADAGIAWLKSHPDSTIDDVHGAELAEATFRKDAKTLHEHLGYHNLRMDDVRARIVQRQGK